MAPELVARVKAEAEKDAVTAVAEGATAPWGDGETLPDASAWALYRDLGINAEDRGLIDEVGVLYDRAFRAAIDELAPAAAEAQ
jgi:hypothetical protein